MNPIRKGLVIGVILLFMGLAFAQSINANINSIIIEPIADLNCEGTLTWKYPEPGEIYTGHFIVQNIGEPESLLDWEIYNWPVWGTWTFNPSSWDDQRPEDGQVIVEVSVIWPDEINDPGQILIINSNNFEDICEIDICISPKCDTNIVDDNFVEFTTEVCGFNGGKQTVKLTQQQADEVEALFKSIREQLNATDSREEAEEIFKDAVVELDKYGLLGGLSIQQTQKFITTGHSNFMINKEASSKKLDKFNFLCLIVGSVYNSYVYSLSQRFTIKTLFLLAMLTSIAYDSNSGLLQSLSFLLYYSFIMFWFGKFLISELHKLPVPAIFGMIGIGKTEYDLWGGSYYTPAKGWIKTSGLLGKRDWNGEFYGDLRTEMGNMLTLYHIGVIGFHGIKIFSGSAEEQRYFFLGFAPLVKIE